MRDHWGVEEESLLLVSNRSRAQCEANVGILREQFGWQPIAPGDAQGSGGSSNSSIVFVNPLPSPVFASPSHEKAHSYWSLLRKVRDVSVA